MKNWCLRYNKKLGSLLNRDPFVRLPGGFPCHFAVTLNLKCRRPKGCGGIRNRFKWQLGEGIPAGAARPRNFLLGGLLPNGPRYILSADRGPVSQSAIGVATECSESESTPQTHATWTRWPQRTGTTAPETASPPRNPGRCWRGRGRRTTRSTTWRCPEVPGLPEPPLRQVA